MKNVSTSRTAIAAIVAIVLCMVGGLLFTGCSSSNSGASNSSMSSTQVAPAQTPSQAQSSSKAASAGEMTVTVELLEKATSPEAPDSPDQFAEENLDVSVGDGATVLDALEATGREFETSGSKDNTEIVRIGGLSNGDVGATSHWECAVNGTDISASPAVYVLSNGDTVTFTFVA